MPAFGDPERCLQVLPPSRRERIPHACDSIVIELVIVFRGGMPVRNIGLVPDLEVPLQNLVFAITLDKMRRYTSLPSRPRACNLSADCSIHRRWCSSDNESDRAQDFREVFRHEPKLHHRTNASGFVFVEDPIEDFEIVNRLAVRASSEKTLVELHFSSATPLPDVSR